MFQFILKAFDPTTTLGPCGTFPYGYVGEHVKPCIYIKLNKIWGWEPRPVQCNEEYQGYDYDYDCPDSLRKHLNSLAAKEAGEENIWIDCYGRSVELRDSSVHAWWSLHDGRLAGTRQTRRLLRAESPTTRLQERSPYHTFHTW